MLVQPFKCDQCTWAGRIAVGKAVIYYRGLGWKDRSSRCSSLFSASGASLLGSGWRTRRCLGKVHLPVHVMRCTELTSQWLHRTFKKKRKTTLDVGRHKKAK